jgi:hypothetical protein
MNLLGIGSGRILVVGLLILFIMFLPVRVALTEQSDAAGKGNLAGCPSLQQTSYPKTSISNGIVNAVVYLPDAKNGYYLTSGVRRNLESATGSHRLNHGFTKYTPQA